MAILHKNISAEGDIHNPKWFSGANNGDVAWRNELGVLESTDELVLPAALDFVDGSVAPPTSNSGDIYVLSSGASVNAGWGTVSLGDWVRYDGTTWNVITPQKSSLCYNETTDALNSYDGSIWSAIGSGGGGGASIYTADDTIGAGRVATLTDTLTFKDGTVNIQGAGTSTGSALSIYDNDTTPNKLWDFLDNGNVNLGGDSVINQDSNVLQFSNINSIGGLKFNGTSNNGIGLNLANGSNDFDFVVAGSSNTLIGTGSLGLLVGGSWAMQVKQNRQISIGSNFEPVAGYDLSVDKAYFDTEITVKAPAGIMQFNGYRTHNIDPSTATFPNDKDFGVHKNTSSGDVFLAFNDGGTIKKVQLT